MLTLHGYNYKFDPLNWYCDYIRVTSSRQVSITKSVELDLEVSPQLAALVILAVIFNAAPLLACRSHRLLI
jgi:hypothetical protein